MLNRRSLAVELFTRLSLIAADVVVLAATWIRTYRHIREASRLSLRVNLSEIFLVDGEFMSLDREVWN